MKSSAPPDDTERLAALARYDILDTPIDPIFDEITRLASFICKTPIALISFVDKDRQWFKSVLGLGVKQTDLRSSICSKAILEDDILVVPDTTKDKRFESNPLVSGDPSLRFYAGGLLRTDDGHAIGTLCVLDYKPQTPTSEQIDALQILARQVMAQLELRRTLRQQQAFVNDLIQSESDLQKSDYHFRQLADSIPQLVWTARPDGWIFWYNQGWYEYTGKTHEEMEGWGWQSVHHPDYLAAVSTEWQKSINSGIPFEMTFPLRSGAGEFRPFLTRVRPLFDKNGNITLWFGTNTDVGNQKRAEDELRKSKERLVIASDSAGLGIFEWEATADLVRFENNRTYDILGVNYDLAPITAARFKSEILLPSEIKKFESSLNISFERDEKWHVECEIRRGDGENRWIEFQGRFVAAEKDSPLRLLAVVTDITDRKRAAAERQELLVAERNARNEAERIGTLKDEFLATLSHELRTPLNAILGWSQLLKRKTNTPEKLLLGLDTIERNTRIQSQLIEDLLDMSRIISGKMRLDIYPVEPASFIEAAIETVRPAADAKEISLRKKFDVNVPSLSVDHNRLQQVVWNLLFNAIKFTPKGGTISASLSRVSTQVEIRISDTGQGIGAEFLPYVFERFRQADASTIRTHTGLGLGLAIVKHLVELHGGSIRAESAGLGKGSSFVVSLPILAASAPQETAESLNQDRRFDLLDFEPKDLSGLKILVVDDEADARELLKRVLQECGAEIVTASSAGEALTILEKQSFSIVVSDIGMPNMDGCELIRQVRAAEALTETYTPAIALSAFARSVDEERNLAAGFNLHLSKPAEPSVLVAQIYALTKADHSSVSAA